MRQKVEDMVQETTRQRQRAAENEQELYRVKQEFDSLRSYVSSLSVRETLISSEKQFQKMEKLFERYVYGAFGISKLPLSYALGSVSFMHFSHFLLFTYCLG